MMKSLFAFALVFALSLAAFAQIPEPAPQVPQTSNPAYQPKSAADKAHSEAEAAALGYIRTLVVAQKLFNRKHGKYADSLTALVGSGSFTRRMTDPRRGDYTVKFRPKADGYTLTLIPLQYDPAHRSFYVDETGTVRAEETKQAVASSPEAR